MLQLRVQAANERHRASDALLRRLRAGHRELHPAEL